MKHLRSIFALLFLVVAGVAGVAVAADARAASDPFGKLTVDEVAAKLGKANTYVFDNNSKESFAGGHVPGAKWLDYDSVTASALPKDTSATLVFYCANEH